MEAALFDRQPKMTTKALASWYGSNRMLAPLVGEALRGCAWVGVPFGGGLAELACIKASSIVVSDLHRHVINLALCVQCNERRPQLAQWLADNAFHPDTLESAQIGCRTIEDKWNGKACIMSGSVKWAGDYFVCSWMGASAKAGTDAEFKGNLSIRWNANGGDSNTRYRSAVASLEAWGEIMRRCNFSVLDCFEFLERCEDTTGNGIYADPPFPGPGDKYKHRFTEADHRKLAAKLGGFKETRVVCRFYDVPFVRELYPEPQWKWNRLVGRKQSNEAAPEVLIVNRSGASA